MDKNLPQQAVMRTKRHTRAEVFTYSYYCNALRSFDVKRKKVMTGLSKWCRQVQTKRLVSYAVRGLMTHGAIREQ